MRVLMMNTYSYVSVLEDVKPALSPELEVLENLERALFQHAGWTLMVFLAHLPDLDETF
jgi:hypothetical protein